MGLNCTRRVPPPPRQPATGLTLACYKGRTHWWDRLIQKWTGAEYSHCEIVLPSGDCLSASPRDGGVRMRRIELDSAHWDLIPLPWASTDAVIQCYRLNRGRGYDWLGILLSQILPLTIDHPRRMFCSEFCAAALGLETPERYCPGHLAEVVRMISHAYEVPHGCRL